MKAPECYLCCWSIIPNLFLQDKAAGFVWWAGIWGSAEQVPSQNWKLHKMPEAFRQTVCGQGLKFGGVAVPNSSFLLHRCVSVPLTRIQNSDIRSSHLAHRLALPENHQLELFWW